MISEFINYMRENLSPQDDKAIVDWLQVTAELSEENETLIKQELSLITDTLKYVKNNFKPEVYQMSLRFPTLCNEIVNGALCFNAGCSEEEVAKFAEIGYLESGYIPRRDDEKGTFTVVQITEPECSVTISDNVSARKLESWIMRTSIDYPTKEIADVLEEYTERYSAQIKRILNEPLQKAFVKAIENSTMVKSLIKFNPVTGEIECVPNSNLETESIENKYRADLIATYEEQMDISFGDKVTDYFGDYGIHHFRYGVSEERVKEIYQRALDAIGMTEDEFKADGSMKYRSNIADRMSEHMSGICAEVDETIEASPSPKMSL